MATAQELQTVRRRLRQKYPQMFDAEGNLKPGYAGKKISRTEKLHKQKLEALKDAGTRTKFVTEELKRAGLTDAELERLTGQRAKKYLGVK